MNSGSTIHTCSDEQKETPELRIRRAELLRKAQHLWEVLQEERARRGGIVEHDTPHDTSFNKRNRYSE